jgi:hypothetical protein
LLKKMKTLILLFLSLILMVSTVNSQVYQNWAARYDYNGGDDQPQAMVIDNNLNAYITGYSSGFVATLKYNKYGCPVQWVNTYENTHQGESEDIGRAITLDNSGNVVINGDFKISYEWDYWQGIKYDNSTGNIMSGWPVWGGGQSDINWGQGVGTDNSNNVYLGISTDDSPNYATMELMKFDQYGNYASGFPKYYPSDFSFQSGINGMFTDASNGYVYFTGVQYEPDNGGAKMATVKYDLNGNLK